MKKTYPHEWTKETILEILRDLDHYFVSKKEQAEVVVIGGVAIVLQDFQKRSTNDVDIAPVSDAEQFLEACKQLGVQAQVITIASTVDFNDISRITLFKGQKLTVYSVTPEELIQLKLERFRKQDPEDIYSIIEKQKIPYERFVQLVMEGKTYFIGRVEEYLISARVTVERMYPKKTEEFKEKIKL